MKTLSSVKPYGDWGYLLLRIAVGSIFIYHGLDKLPLWGTAPEGMALPLLYIMRALSIIEPLAGVAVILGFMVQAAALVLSIVMIGALFAKWFLWKAPFSGQMAWELDLIILGATVTLFLNGGGKLSLDRGQP